MENVPLTCYENLRRYWRRRKYQRLHGSNYNNKRKLKIIRLGDQGTSSSRRQFKARDSDKPKSTCLQKLFSPLKALAKFHDTYVNMMVRLAGNVAHKSSGAGAFAGKKVAKTKQISVVSSGGELVDSKLVLELYKRLATFRQMNIIV